MKKQERVKENRDFERIIGKKDFRKDKNLVIYYEDTTIGYNRFGVSVGTKIGNAVTRNKYKRRMRNIIDKTKNLYSKSKDYIIIVRKNCLDSSFHEIEKSYHTIMNEINNRKGEKDEKE